MTEFDVQRSFFALPVNDNQPRQTVDYQLSLPKNMSVHARTRLNNAVRKAIQAEADNMKFEDFGFTSAKKSV